MRRLRRLLKEINLPALGRKGDNNPGIQDASGMSLATPAQLGDTPMALLEFQSPTAAVIATPVSAVSRYTALIVTAMVFALLAIAATVRVSKVVTAQGKLVSSAPTIMMQPFDTSIVQSIKVHEGEIVRKGQLLAQLNPTFAHANLKALKAQVVALSAEQTRLEAEANGTVYAPRHPNTAEALQAAIFQSRGAERTYTIENYNQKIAELQMIVAKSEHEASFYKKRVNVAQDVENMRNQLQKLQVGSKLNSLIALNDRLTVSSSLSSAIATAAAGERDLAAQRAERDAYQKKWAAGVSEDLAKTTSKLITAEQDLAKARLQSQLVVLRAPRDAIVLTIAHVSVGSVLQSGQKFISLVPIDAPLSIEADISGTESGYVHVGDPVTVNFDTFDFLRYGSAKGTLKSVSADSFSPEMQPGEGGSALPNRPHTLYYKARISLDELMLHNTPSGFRLVPGMPLQANIKVGRRTILSYFVTKIMPVAYDSMREP
ncbi:HlyD family type I secretion periplasmic adaptor subunit [Acidiphilium iwatense]|uniref:Membrane fusion protein (MFP) family protein n=1 Tax=Acidiphilium iwatense TaxID=768198 RepID=A0ABS9DWY7_9PROT|nr:HlyD family type I secretion periplasmic adaptor subunit [Acidiphilium iwatense]MCF3945972.1 HlyD family type I secretion periplasmic adaptor subunit [Acidiphilium iwatense]